MASSMIGPIIQGAMGTVGTIFNSIAGIKADKKLSKLIKEDPKYTSSPYAAKTLALAETLLNSRMPGAAARERNIYGSGANAMSGITRNATDSSQALAAAAGIQGQQTDAFNSLQMQEGQDYYNKLNNLNSAYGGMTQEHKDMFDDEVRRWQDQVNTVLTQYKMRRQGGNDWSQMGAPGASMGGGGGMMGMSDKRLKHNYRVIGKSPSGINIYEFSYLGSNARYQGVMADEVPQASFNIGEYLAVDYSKIDVSFKQVS
jgi:hypothetical protein